MKKKNILKQSIKKIKYLDKTQLNYFIVMTFLLGFCLFTGGTYSYFAFSKHLNAATITIAKLSYTLSSTVEGYTNGEVTVAPGETKAFNLTLESLNGINTKYALTYSTTDANVKVYYSENLKNNMAGTIGPRGSNITLRVVVVNEGTSSSSVNLSVKGGYLQNTLTSNITEGYFEQDIVVRSILLDENLGNGLVDQSFPSKDGEYAYLKTECSQNISATWDNENWKLNITEIGSRVACDVYFKKMTNDIETYLAVKNSDGTSTFIKTIPNDGTYSFDHAECNTGATATWNTETWQMNITNMESKTLCVGYFNKN